MESHEKLFREAERLRTPPGMWETIAARAGMAAESGFPAGGRGWKMAASLVVGMGALAALLSLLEPAPKVAESAGGAEDFAVARAEASPLPDVDDLYWHADLGEEPGSPGLEMEEDALLFEPVAADAGEWADEQAND